MVRNLVVICLLLASGVLLVACERDGLRTEVQGSGTVVAETREVSGFDRIAVAGQGVVHVEITGTETLEVEAEDNILEVLTIEVSGGELRLGVAPMTNIVPTRDITYRITAADISEVAVSGSAVVDVAVLDVDRLEVEISGSGSVTPSGTADGLDVNISGSGRYLGERFETRTASIGVSGSGQATVLVTDELLASVSGSGSIQYLGDPPMVEKRVSGSGSISGS